MPSLAPFRRLPLFVASLVLCFGLVGCTKYEYDLVQPQEVAAHVGTKDWVTAPVDPLSYRLITVDNRLVMQIHNPTGEPVQLLGDRSTLVDPEGESHPLQSQTIAPQSFAKLVLPPMPTRVERTGPSIGFGIGLGLGSGYRRHRGFYPYNYYGGSTFYDEPRYYAVYDPNDATFWEWDGEGTVRLSITYDQGGKPFTHNLMIGRKKV